MKPQLIIFDWAGTTVDYGCFAPVNAFALAFQKFGVNPTVEEIRAPMGMLKRDHIRTMLAMPAIQRQWQENQGAADEAAVEKIYGVFEDSLMGELWRTTPPPKPGWWDRGGPPGPGDPHWLHHRLHRSDDGRGDPGRRPAGYAPRRLVQPGQRPGPGSRTPS